MLGLGLELGLGLGLGLRLVFKGLNEIKFKSRSSEFKLPKFKI